MTQRTTLRTLACALACVGLLAPWTSAQRTAQAARTVVRNVQVGLGDDAPKVTLILKDGRIEAVREADAAAPPGSRTIDGSNLVCVPGFIDAFSNTGIETPAPVADKDVPVDTGADARVDMREANRKGIQPGFRVVEKLKLEPDAAEAWRQRGFGALLVAPTGELLSGTSALASTRTAAMRDVVVRPEVFAHAAFRASGEGFPRTLMAHHAQLRQFFLDARRQAELEQRFTQGRPGPRPPYDPELDAAGPLLSKHERLVCEARSDRDVERWVRLADELGLSIAISGGRDAWKVAALLVERDIPVILTLDWGEEVEDPDAKDEKKKERGRRGPGRGGRAQEAATEEVDEPDEPADEPNEEDEPEQDPAEGEGEDAPDEPKKGESAKKDSDDDRWKYEEPLAVRRERRRLWEERRDNALRLHEAGVRIAFGTGDGKAKDLLDRVRELVEAGLSREVALTALTRSASELLGASGRLGAIEPGYDATFGLWTKDPLDEKAQLAWIFVDGEAYELEVKEEGAAQEGEGPAEGVLVTGTWKLEFPDSEGQGPSEATAVLAMDDEGAVTGTLSMDSPIGEGATETDIAGRVVGSTLTATANVTVGEMTIDVKLDAQIDGDTLTGDVTWSGPWGERTTTIQGTREPESGEGL